MGRIPGAALYADLFRFVRRSPIFWVLLAAKLVAGACFGSQYIRGLFIPFVSYFIDSGFDDPYAYFAARRPEAFPYSALMLFILGLPQALVSPIASGLVHESEGLRMLLMRLPMLAADVTILAVLCRWFETKRERVLLLYWCSPVLFYVSYVHGQIDSIPTAFLFLSLLTLSRRRYAIAGVLLGMGIATKFHLFLAVPFTVVFILRNAVREPRSGKKVLAHGAGIALTLLALVVPFLSSEGYRKMVFGTRETARMFELVWHLGDSMTLFLAPAAVGIVILRFFSTPKVNRDLLLLFMALAYGLLVLFVPPMPGWYFWLVPVAIYFYIRQNEDISSFSLWFVSGVYAVYYLFFWHGIDGGSPGLRLAAGGFGALTGTQVESLVFTGLQASLAMLVYWIYRIGIKSNQEYGLRLSPYLVGIGGDSSTGKHTLAAKLRALVGKENSAETYGDDYHRWARGDEAWKKHTHLDPKANFLHKPMQHMETLKEGRGIEKPVYDHSTGRFTAPVQIQAERFVFFLGLHPFYLRRMRDLIDIKIYMEPDEQLRRFWKVRRDQAKRGYAPEQVIAQIESRKDDFESHVRPQRQFADWIVSYLPVRPIDIDSAVQSGEEPAIFVRHELKNDFPMEELVAHLEAVPNVRVEWDMKPDLEHQSLVVHEVIAAQSVKRIAFRMFPNLHELVGSEDISWSDGNDGIGQLIFLMLLSEVARNRGARGRVDA